MYDYCIIHLYSETIPRLGLHSHKYHSEKCKVGNTRVSSFRKTQAGFPPCCLSTLVPALGSDLGEDLPTQDIKGSPQPGPGVHFTHRTSLHGLILWFGFHINNSISMAEAAVSKDVIKGQLLGFQTIFLKPLLGVPGVL